MEYTVEYENELITDNSTNTFISSQCVKIFIIDIYIYVDNPISPGSIPNKNEIFQSP
jgi:hypothetical protein